MSSVSPLSLSKAVDENTLEHGWDETIDDRQEWQKSSFRASIASHAIAHKTVVCGTVTRDGEDWLTWKTSFAPHQVCRVASSSDGKTIAATMDNGTVSILRGSDGVVLATRRVTSEGVRIPAEIAFVSNDTLLVVPPEEASIILVSAIDGERLNSSNQGVVSEAARSMSIHALRFEGCNDIRSIRGCYNGNHTIRFALVDGEGKLSIYDYDLLLKQSSLVKSHVLVGKDKKNWEIDFDVGLRVQLVAPDRPCLLMAASHETLTKIMWFDMVALEPVADYNISKDGIKSTRVITLEALASCNESVAVVVTCKYGKDSPKIETKVVQAALFNEASIGTPHVLFTIPTPSSVKSLSIAPLEAAGRLLSFRCKTWMGEENHDCFMFKTASNYQNGSAIAKIRLLAMRECYDEAHGLVEQFGAESLIRDAFARFHPAEITLCRFRQALYAGRVSGAEATKQSREYIRQLVLAAHGGNEYGQRSFLSAVTTMFDWPDENVVQNPPTVGEVIMALKGFLSAIPSVSGAFEGRLKVKLDAQVKRLEERLEAMEHLGTILRADHSMRLSGKFASFRSSRELFTCLIQNGCFTAAEHMWKSKLREKLTTETLVAATLGIASTVNPRQYASLLEEIVFPSLAINHELLPSLLAWSCETADAFDDESTRGHGLDEAVYLLEISERATKNLRVRVHGSFARHAPFAEKKGTKRRKVSPRNTSLNESTASSFSFTNPVTSKENPIGGSARQKTGRANPTILELSRMKGGAQLARSGQVSSLLVDAVDESEEIVESKLRSARCLMRARALGLDRTLVRLRSFAMCGGAQFVAKELLRLCSSSSRSHEERFQFLAKQGRQFCFDSAADFDLAISEYAKELCGDKNTTKKAIEESASLARCCIAPETRCTVTLVSLRAALFCRFSPAWLSKLSLEAIQWAAGDTSLRSELEEASRLLLIDGIVGRYCGEGAKELFHVDNPRHAMRLLEFVSVHLDHETVLADALDLCDAFAHLSREDACSRIVQNAILRGREDTCTEQLQTLYSKDTILAKAVFSRVVSFCVDIIEDGAVGVLEKGDEKEVLNKTQQEVVLATKCAYRLAKIALSFHQKNAGGPQGGFSSVYIDEQHLESLIEGLQRLKTLQHDHRIFLSLADLRDASKLVAVATELMMPIAASYLDAPSIDSSHGATEIKRICSLLAGYSEILEDELWYTAIGASACKLVYKTKGTECLRFLTDLGVLEASKHELVARSCLAVALSLCVKVSKQSASNGLEGGMKSVLMASSILSDYTLQRSPQHLLESTLSLGELCDVIGHVLVRSDEGIGEELDEFRKRLHLAAAQKRQSLDAAKGERGKEIANRLRLRQPNIHSSWYIGDGLLLPPKETLVRGMDYCKQTVAKRAPAHEAIFNLVGFVEARGAHALSLRLLIMSSSKQICTPTNSASYESLADASLKNLTALAERHLGGTGNGITSGMIDSQLAVSFLLSLPLRTAFKIFKSTLPTAITTRDFKRLVTLAGIGKVAGSGDLFKANGATSLHLWKKQSKFVAQCETLSLRAKWWSILQLHRVRFDPGRFDDHSQRGDGKENQSSNYIASLTPSLISNMSKVIHDTENILQTASDFLVSFGLGRDLAVQAYINYLLSPLDSEQASGATPNLESGSMKLSAVEAVVKRLVRRLHPPVNRVRVLRDCLVRLEDSRSGQDYERISVVLGLYHSELTSILHRDAEKNGADTKPLVSDLELVDRRRDALAILSSYFQGENRKHRPSFSSFFLPLASRKNSNVRMTASRQILGLECVAGEKGFDPLQPLESILQGASTAAVMSALAPLCLPLGVPRGYIHARCLIGRFRRLKTEAVSLPSFEVDVLPVLNRLTSSADIADIAEWCSAQYCFKNEDKLTSLNHALNFAIRASDEAERHGGHRRNIDLHEEDIEQNALNRVKRITAAKDMLSDRLAINTILQSVGITSEKACTVSVVVKRLMEKLEEHVWSKTEFSPEYFVEVFLRESSLLAAEASLSSDLALSTGQFRELSMLVHRACKSVADKYSHVQVGNIARKFVDKFLFYGDQETVDSKKAPAEVKPVVEVVKQRLPRPIPEIEEDDTTNFIMDLSSLRESDDGWSSVAAAEASATSSGAQLTSEEESSSLKLNGSVREASEYASQRVSLRIAFVMAYADGYHSSDTSSQSKDENSRPVGLMASKRQNRTLLGKLSSRGSKHRDDSVLAHSRELLRIVFAKTSVAGIVEKDMNRSMEQTSRSQRQRSGKTITFAMRHRALRTSSILCPQDALEEVVDEEKLVESECSLTKCSFGVFVAKEIEEMGLPLPHSDLTQLSTMHFPSYARTLWRHHRNVQDSKGRLLLLILEMYLKEIVSDYGFVLSILEEMSNLNLSRTLLLALEAVCLYLDRVGQAAAAAFIQATRMDVANTIEWLSRIVLAEIEKLCGMPNTPQDDVTAGSETLRRLGVAVQYFSCSAGMQKSLGKFVGGVLDLICATQKDKFNAGDVLGHALKRISREEFDSNFKNRVSALVSEGKIGDSVVTSVATREGDLSDSISQQDQLGLAIQSFESSLQKASFN